MCSLFYQGDNIAIQEKNTVVHREAMKILGYPDREIWWKTEDENATLHLLHDIF